MKQPMIVLHVVGRMDIGGAESRIMDLYRHIDREKVQFYFMQHTTDKCAFEDEIKQLGGKVYHVPRFQVKNYAAYKKAWQDFFKNHPQIRVVHGHMTSTASIYLPIAKKMGVAVTIAHARSAGVDGGLKGYLTRLLRKDLYKKCDYRFTCSFLAGESVFGDQSVISRKAVFIPNAIEVEKFKYRQEIRTKIRKDLGIEDCFVIGHVGRFSLVKNHGFLLEIMKQCMIIEKEQKLPKTMLMLLGDGELRKTIAEKAAEMGMAERILFLGNQRQVSGFYQAMDFFLLPSFYEGLPGTAIEAQASGVPGILSDTVTKEAIITDLLQSRSITEDPRCWARKILEEDRILDRCKYAQLVRKAGFDVKEQAKRMQEFYLTGKLQ